MANHSSFCWILSSICWSKIFQKWLSSEGEASGSQGTKGEGVVGKAQQEKAGGGSSKRVESGRISGKLLDSAYYSAIKNKQRKRQTILLRSLELNIFKNSDKILEQKQNRQSIGFRAKKSAKLQNNFNTEFRRTSGFMIQQFLSNKFCKHMMISMNHLITEIWTNNINEIKWSSCEKSGVVLISYFAEIL